MPLTLKFIGALRQISGKPQLKVNFQQGLTLKTLVAKVSIDMPKLRKIFSDQQLGDARSNALVLVNSREISVLDGLETVLCDGDEIVFIPVVHGG